MAARQRAVSSKVPLPMTRCHGSPVNSSANVVIASMGFESINRMVSGLWRTISGNILRISTPFPRA